jgi:putative hydrolase of the HAD superfamily
MAKIKAVIFDLDDTLYAERNYVRSGYSAVADCLRRQLGRNEQFEDWLWDRFMAGRNGNGNGNGNAFGALSDEFGLALSDRSVGAMVEVYRQHTPDIHPYEGIPEMLGLLRQAYRLGLLSDGFLPAQQLKLQSLRIERFFDSVLFTESLGRDFWKPHPRGFQMLQDAFAVKSDECVYVADNPAKDFSAPNSLGWRSVQYLRSGQIHTDKPSPPGGGPQTIVRDIAGICNAIRRQ